MIDIDFYMNVFELKKEIMNGKLYAREYIADKLEEYRSLTPIIYNIETTNACNMRCVMCPRTTMMTRPVQNLDMDIFKTIIDQIAPFSDEKWHKWEKFVEASYGIPRDDMSENHFFLHIIPKVIVLHGYGDPLLDKDMPNRIRRLSERGIPSYFSCNPANIDIDRTSAMFDNGLDYIKYSIESVSDERHKTIRGGASNFSDSYRKILKLLDVKAKKDYGCTIVITMLNLHEAQYDEFDNLKDVFKDQDVYIYLKSQDQQWYQDKHESTKSLHWLEFCQFPWSSMTIKSNAEAAMCVEDFNNEIILGNTKFESLTAIWNSEKYKKFRQDHFDLTPGLKCTQQCDMKLIGSFVNHN